MTRLIWSYRKKLQDQGPNPIIADDTGSLLVGIFLLYKMGLFCVVLGSYLLL